MYTTTAESHPTLCVSSASRKASGTRKYATLFYSFCSPRKKAHIFQEGISTCCFLTKLLKVSILPDLNIHLKTIETEGHISCLHSVIKNFIIFTVRIK